ncbi:Na(+) H(+) antiporter subunit A [hydrothermal vent metagenome]|uniref:Na(+) H(+) antiporter subunit A n=1 Tax=hydrothermal vent metagenome TaxID=652676 RepID=A0A3B1D1K7_9ZZZZ
MEIESIRPFLAVAVSLIAAAGIVVARKSPNIREGFSLTAAGAKFLIVLTMIPAVIAGSTFNYTLFSVTSGISIAFKVDAMGLLFAITASFLWILITLYSIGYMRSLNEHAQTRFYLCFAVILSATMGVAFAANLLTLFIFYEIVSFFVYPLVVHNETEDSFSKGNKYIFYIFVMGKLFMLAGFLVYGLSGTFDFDPKGVFPGDTSAFLLTVTFILFLIGISKAAMIPFHAWLPAAMTGPMPVIASLAVIDIGAFGILRAAYYLFGLETLKRLDLGFPLIVLACFTIVAASVMALTKDDLKARLVYSTIGQISYTLLGAALLVSAGLTGGILQLVNHGIAKATLFFCAGAIFVVSGKTNVSQLNGIGKKMPWTMGAFTLGALSIIGVPPFAGFISKWYLVLGAAEVEQYTAIGVLVLSSILSASYLLPIVYAAFFRDLPEGETSERQEAPMIMLVPIMIAAVGTLALFFAPSIFLDLARVVMGEVG